jgi:hypothetical protein
MSTMTNATTAPTNHDPSAIRAAIEIRAARAAALLAHVASVFAHAQELAKHPTMSPTT